MIKSNNKWSLSLEVDEGFETRVKDSYSCIIDGNFDKEEIENLLSDYLENLGIDSNQLWDALREMSARSADSTERPRP